MKTLIEIQILKILVGIYLVIAGSGCDMVSIPTQAAIPDPPPVISESGVQPISDPRVDGLVNDVNTLNGKIDDLVNLFKSQQQKAEPPKCAPKTGIVYFYRIPACPPCAKGQAEIEAAVKMGANAIQFEFRDAPQDLKTWAQRHYGAWPILQWYSSDGQLQTYEGWSTLSDFMQQYESPKKMMKAAGGSTSLNQGANGDAPAVYSDPIYFTGYQSSQWSWPGDLRVHLTQAPHSLSVYQVRRMTRAQCIQVHTSYHNRYGARVKDHSKHIARLQNKIGRLQSKSTVMERVSTFFSPAPVVRSYRARAYSSFCPNC